MRGRRNEVITKVRDRLGGVCGHLAPDALADLVTRLAATRDTRDGNPPAGAPAGPSTPPAPPAPAQPAGRGGRSC